MRSAVGSYAVRGKLKAVIARGAKQSISEAMDCSRPALASDDEQLRTRRCSAGGFPSQNRLPKP